MDISYEYYKVFYYVATLKSFTKAAGALYANQPNVTRTIKNLERSLGCALFVRSNRSVRLTPEGEKLYARVKIAVEQIEAGEEELARDNSLQSGTVSIGATENTLHYVLLPVLRAFRARYPDVTIRVTNFNTNQAVDALKNGAVDFSVVTSPVRLSEALKAEKLLMFREVAVCSRQFAERTGVTSPLSIAEICKYPLISLGCQTMTYEFYTQFFYENGARLSPDIEVATADQIVSMVKSGLGIGFVPEYFIRGESDVCILQTQPAAPDRTICLIRPADRALPVAAKEFARMIAAHEK